MENSFSRVDLHVHTRYSMDAGDWLLHQLGMNECYTTPQEAYDLARARGMDFVTIADHDTIDGALEVAHLDRFFISEEITALFPEDGVRVHVVALQITEENHRVIQALKFNLYELLEYLDRQKIVHFIAHPFFRMGEKLTLEHFEKMVLLFKVFEIKNGGKQLYPDNLLEKILRNLTPERIWDLADKHDLAPVGDSPWRKSMVAGSDDHGGILIGEPHTLCPKVDTVQELLRHIEDGKSRTEGQGGTPLAVAHSIFAVTFRHFKAKQDQYDPIHSKIAWNLLSQLFDGANLQRALSWQTRLALLLKDNLAALNTGNARQSAKHLLKKQLATLLRDDAELRRFLEDGLEFNHTNHKRLFEIINRLINMILAELLRTDRPDMGLRLDDKLKVAAAAVSLVAPYFIAYKTESRDRLLMRTAAEKYARPDKGYPPKRIAVFVDRPAEKVRASRMLERFLHDELAAGAEIVVFGTAPVSDRSARHMNFTPVATLQVTALSHKFVEVPPILEIAQEFSERSFDLVYVHSVGSMGLAGAFLGRWMHIPVIARYPLPSIRTWLRDSHDHSQKKLIATVLRTLFLAMSEVRVPNPAASASASALGIPENKIRPLQQQLPHRTLRHHKTRHQEKWPQTSEILN